MQPVYLRHHIALLSLLRVREGEKERERERERNSGSEVLVFGLILGTWYLYPCYMHIKCTAMQKCMDVRGLRGKWRMRKRAKERKRDRQRKKDAMPFNKPPLRDWRGFRRKGNTGIVRCQFEVKDRRKRSRGDHLHFRLKTNWRSIEDQSKINWEPNAERVSCRFARVMLKG